MPDCVLTSSASYPQQTCHAATAGLERDLGGGEGVGYGGAGWGVAEYNDMIAADRAR